MRRSPEAARENILQSAERLLLERGPQGLKLVEVAQGAGVSHATVLHHFGSIDGVQTALAEAMIRQLVARVLEAERPEDPEAQLEGVGQVAEDRSVVPGADCLEEGGDLLLKNRGPHHTRSGYARPIVIKTAPKTMAAAETTSRRLIRSCS